MAPCKSLDFVVSSGTAKLSQRLSCTFRPEYKDVEKEGPHSNSPGSRSRSGVHSLGWGGV